MRRDEPEFRYPEDTFVGASERLNYYRREFVKTLLAQQPFKALIAGIERFLHRVIPHG